MLILIILTSELCFAGDYVNSYCKKKTSSKSCLVSGLGSESSHEGMIDKETKTKERKYLGGECLHTNTLRWRR